MIAGLFRARLGRPVQTNEPGRCVGLYGALLWLAECHRLPVRLLEIGASAGLNLNADRFRYVVAGDAGRLIARAGYHGPPVVWEMGAG